MKNWLILSAIVVLLPVMTVNAQQSLAEKLGYPADSKLLIVHAADMGMSHSTNMACIRAIEKKAVNSGSVGSLLLNPLLFRQVLKIAAEYGMPLTIPMNMVKMMAPQLIGEIPSDAVVVDNFYSMYGEISKGDWKTTYEKMISRLQPGLNEMIFHLSYDNDEMKAIAIDHEEFGSSWRQKDFDFVMSDEFGQMLQKSGVQLVSWRQIQQTLKQKP